MFPTMYEDEGDRANEQSAKARIEEEWGVLLHKLPTTHPIDFVATRGERILAWIEYKKRTFRWGDYPSVIISVRKISSLRRFASVVGKAIFVVEDRTGELRAARIALDERFDLEACWGGQTQTTRDPTDIEPVVMLPLDRFRPIDGRARGQ